MRKIFAKLRKIQQGRRQIAREKIKVWSELFKAKGPKAIETNIALLRQKEAVRKTEEAKYARLKAQKKLALKLGRKTKVEMIDAALETKIELLSELDYDIKEHRRRISEELRN
ncbi:MAG: hypothetical protein WC746_03090 [archaeon]|jgi:hypothetical protein